jgi:hypothetical protein
MSRMTARTSINNETDGIGAPKIWLTRLFQPGTAANRSSADRIGPSVAVRSNLVTDQTNPNHAFLVGTIPHGKFRFDTATAAGTSATDQAYFRDMSQESQKSQAI